MLLDACAKAGLTVALEPWLHGALADSRALCGERVGAGVDALVVLGGDGTLLRAMPHAVGAGIPLFGVNLGRVGFLTEVETGLDDQARVLERAMRALAGGGYFVEERMLFSVCVAGEPEAAGRIALNDAVIARDATGGVLALDAYLDDTLIDHYSADGLVVSTPTGSTAYSLAAGGPIVAPEVACMVLSPICPHSLHARPMVLSAQGVLRVHLRAVPGAKAALLTTDGQAPALLAPGTDVSVRRCAHQTARFIRLRDRSFFTLLRTKLTEWSV
ncbi:MAG: NAD(+)/NADH kinase [Clostridia bacterium]|nr:NAD(+)/NADH kinase [Clostridia bacterium]